MNRVKKSAELLSDRLELPSDAVAGSPKLTLSGRRQLFVENHRGILSYGDRRIVVDCGSMRVCITGDELELAAMDKADMLIEGRILSVELE